MSDHKEHPPEGPSVYQEINWWVTLVVAVLAVPSFGLIVSALLPLHGLGAVIAFVLACWLCTYLGMRVMHNPHMQQKIDFKQKK